MAGIAADDFRGVQPLGVIILPCRVDILDPEIELESVSGGDLLFRLGQLKARAVTQFDHREIFPMDIRAPTDRFEECDGPRKIGDGQPQMRQSNGRFCNIIHFVRSFRQSIAVMARSFL